MMRRNRPGVHPLLISTLVCLSIAPALGRTDPAAAPETIPVPDTIRARNVPPLVRSELAGLRPYENLRYANFQGWHPAERRLLITTRFAETYQLHEVAMPLGARTQLTFLDERVFDAHYRPGRPDQIVFSSDQGGAENYQLFLMDRARGTTERVSDGVDRYMGALWSHRGNLLAYVSNARNGRDFDLYVADPGRAGGERRVAELSGTWFPLDWSPDDRRLLVDQYISANESNLYLVDLDSGERQPVVAPEPDVKAAWLGGRWSRDGRSVYTTTDSGGEFRRLVRIDLGTGARTVLSGDIDWNVEDFDLSDDGRLLAFFTNEDGASHLHFLDASTGEPRPAPDLPPGVASGARFRPGSHELGFTLNWARSPSDVYSFDPAVGELVRWTASEVGGLDAGTFAVPELVRFPTFDEAAPGRRRTIPAFVFHPDPRRFPGPRPVYINIHGGPEAQARPTFQGSNNYLIDTLGVAIIYPNVRGSDGYGKSYLELDNGKNREGSVRDIGALLDWIATQPDLDAGRVMVGGGSYGGYMSLATLVHYSQRLRAGFDYVGISNFVTFLEHTGDYRRDLRRAEYGDERDPEMRRFLESISPANRAASIRRPLLVAQGANDPRVPLEESDRIVSEVENNGEPVWYIVATDEGHGFQKKSNADYLRATWIEFIDRYLVEPAAAAGTAGTTPASPP